MGKTKSIGEKIAGTMKDIVSIAANAADHAMKTDEAPPTVDERSAAYIPLAADGLVSDPMMVPPIAAVRHESVRPRDGRQGRAGRLEQRRLSKNPSRSLPRKPQPGGRGAPPKRPRGKPAGKRPKKRRREIAERAEAPHRGAISALRCRRDGWTLASRGRTSGGTGLPWPATESGQNRKKPSRNHDY